MKETDFENLITMLPIIKLQVIQIGEQSINIEKIDNAEKAASLVNQYLQSSDKEMLIVICVDSKCKPLSIETVSIGCIDTTFAVPCNIYKNAILSNAYGIFVFHNHVSGESQPSKDDILATNSIEEVVRLVGIKLIDHIIIGSNNYTSMRAKGYIGNKELPTYKI